MLKLYAWVDAIIISDIHRKRGGDYSDKEVEDRSSSTETENPQDQEEKEEEEKEVEENPEGENQEESGNVIYSSSAVCSAIVG